MPTVKMPDGQLVDMPDNPTPEQLAGLRRLAVQSTQVPPSPDNSLWDTVKHKAKLFGSDVVKGVAGLPALILDLASINPETGKPPEKFGGVSGALQSSMTTPRTEGEKWQSAATQGAAGGLTGGVPGIVTGAGAGVGSEVAAREFGDGFLPRLLGGLAGGAAVGRGLARVGRVSTNAETLAREAVEGISPELLTKAKNFMSESGRQGVSMDLAQALEAVGAPASNVTTMRNVLANNKAGTKVQEILRNQPTDLQLRATTAIGGMPGTVWGEQQAANNLAETATQAVDAAKQARSQTVRPFYESAGNVSQETQKDLIALAKSWAEKPGATEELKAAARDFTVKLSKTDKVLEDAVTAARAKLAAATSASQRQSAQAELAKANSALAAAKPTSLRAADIDTWIGEAVGPYKGSPLSPVNPKTLGQVKGLAGALNQRFKESSPEITKAEQAFSNITQQTINPLKQGPVGQLATPRGYKPDVQASIAKMNGLFSAGVDPQAKLSPIKQAATELAKVDKEAFADAAKTYYSGKISQAFEPTINSALSTNGQAADRLWGALFASEKQYQGMKDTVTSIAKTYGLSEQAAARGLENFAQITKALRNRTEPGGVARDEIFRIGGKNYGADALRVFGFLPFERAARRIEDHTMSNAFRDFDNLLTTPEGVGKLIELSKVPAISDKALKVLGFAGGVTPGVSSSFNLQDITNQ